MMRFFFLSLVLAGPACTVFAASKEVAKLTCTKRELETKNCHLRSGNTQLHLFQDKIISSDGVERGLEPLSVDGVSLEWQDAKVTSVGGRPFLEMYLWTAPVNQSEVESLIWSVYEIAHAKTKFLVKRDVQKRKKIVGIEDKSKWKFDRRVKHGLRAEKNKILWFFENESGELSKSEASK